MNFLKTKINKIQLSPILIAAVSAAIVILIVLQNRVRDNKNNFESNFFEVAILIDLNMKDDACKKYLILKNQFIKELENKKNENPSVISMIEKTCK